MSLEYVAEKMAEAVRSLAVMPDRIQERLAAAYLDCLGAEAQLNESVPAELADELRKLLGLVDSAEPAGDEGTIRAFCETLSDEEASDIARQFVDLEFSFDSERVERLTEK